MAPHTGAKLTLANRYVPLHYHLKLDINHTKPNFQGEVVIDLVANTRYTGTTEDGFQLTLHADKLIITKAVVNDLIPLKVTYDRTAREVKLSTTEAIDPKSVTLTYMGQINQINTFQDLTQGLFKTNYLDSILGKSNNYIIATHFQPHAAKLVFPLIEELHIKAPISLEVTTLGRFKVMSVAPLISLTPVSMLEMNVFKFKPTPPIAALVFGFVIGDFEFLEETVRGKPVRVYTAIGEMSGAKLAVDYIAKFLPVIEDMFQVEYPLEKLDFVGLPFLNDGAMENWGLVTVLSLQLQNTADAPFQTRLGLQQLVAHELVHQWMGDLVTFDNWNQLWFNEAFATWMGNLVVKNSEINKEELDYTPLLQMVESREDLMQRDCFYGDGGEYELQQVLLFMNNVNTDLNCLTTTLFDEAMYEKGMALIAMIYGMFVAEGSTKFFEGCGRFLTKYKYQSTKVFELWKTLNDDISVDLPTFAHSWLNATGLPRVLVEVKNGQIAIEQHRYLRGSNAQDMKLEDTPYHLPLYIKVLQASGSTKLLNVVLSDRRMELDIPEEQFLGVNSLGMGYYRLHYDYASATNIAKNIKHMELAALLTILHDFGAHLEDAANLKVSGDDLLAFLTLLDLMASDDYTIDYDVVKIALKYLDSVNDCMRHFSDYTKFGEWVSKFQKKMFNKMGDWDKLTLMTHPTMSLLELQARNLILMLGINTTECQDLAKTMFKNFRQAGKSKKFTLRYTIAAILNVYMAAATPREYKDVLELVRNADVLMLSHLDITIGELQTMAVSSLGFVSDPQLLHKTLNFVGTNIDSKLIELGLLGFRYKTDTDLKLQLFKWYKVNYDKWAPKLLRPGSDWAAQLKVTLANTNKLILGTIMNHDAQLIRMRDEFIKEKLAKLPEHGLQAALDEVDNTDNEAVGSVYATIANKL